MPRCPEIMANSVAAPLERRLGEIAGVTEITSTSSIGNSSIVVQFDTVAPAIAVQPTLSGSTLAWSFTDPGTPTVGEVYEETFEVRRKGFSLAKARGESRGRVKMNEFLIFNKELIALLKAGLPVVRSFEILLERQKSPTLRRVLADVRQRVNSGSSISEAFAAEGMGAATSSPATRAAMA